MEGKSGDVEVVEVRAIELELLEGLATSVGAHSSRPVVLVRVVTGEGVEGWGECVALAEPTYTEEYSAGAAAVLVDHILPRFLAPVRLSETPRAGAGLAGPPEPLSSRLRATEAIRGNPMARAAVEMAVLDAGLRGRSESLAAFLGATRTTVPAGATVGLSGTLDGTLEAVGRAVELGYRRVKCKIEPGNDLEPVAAVRSAFPELALSVDANGAYRLAENVMHEALLELDALGLTAIEQPLAPDDLAGHAHLASELSTPVVLDESIRSLGDLDTAAALRACDGVSIKPGRLGGIVEARRVHDRCVQLGLHCTIGGMLETGLARAAALAVAALPGFDLPGDLGASDRYFVPDLTEPHLLVGGQLAVPDGPGLGVRLNTPLLTRRSRLLATLTLGS